MLYIPRCRLRKHCIEGSVQRLGTAGFGSRVTVQRPGIEHKREAAARVSIHWGNLEWQWAL